MLPQQFQQLLEKFSRGACTPEEEQFINDWYHNIGAKEVPFLEKSQRDLTERRIWSAINPKPVSSGKRRIIRAAVIALPVLIFAGLYFNRQTFTTLITPDASSTGVATENNTTLYTNPGSSPKKLALPDGTSVVLQPSSELHIDKDFGMTQREVFLKGEGFFNVSFDENKPFVVYADEVVTRVLGTSFNVRAYENDKEITVAVKTGKVSVYASKNRTSRQVMHAPDVILTPNQQMVYNRVREVIFKQLVEQPEIVLPDSELFRMQFENTEVSEIFDVLQKNYGVEIRFDKNILDNCRLTTSMSDEGLYERIAVICKAIGASWKIDDVVITISSNGC